MLCNSLIISKVDYGLLAYYPFKTNFRNKLSKILNKCKYFCTSIKNNLHNNLTIENRFLFLSLSYLYKNHVLTPQAPCPISLTANNFRCSARANPFPLNITKPKTETFKNSFYYKAISYWNSLSENYFQPLALQYFSRLETKL